MKIKIKKPRATEAARGFWLVQFISVYGRFTGKPLLSFCSTTTTSLKGAFCPLNLFPEKIILFTTTGRSLSRFFFVFLKPRRFRPPSMAFLPMKNPPVGPSGVSGASQRVVSAASSSEREASGPPRAVRVHPGQTEFSRAFPAWAAPGTIRTRRIFQFAFGEWRDLGDTNLIRNSARKNSMIIR